MKRLDGAQFRDALVAALRDQKDPLHTQAANLARAIAQMVTSPMVRRLPASVERANELLALADTGTVADFDNLEPIDGLSVLAVIAMADEAAIKKARLMLTGEATQNAKSALGRQGAAKLHEKTAAAAKIVLAEWAKHRGEYGDNKSQFARVYVQRLKREHGVLLTEATIRRWLGSRRGGSS